MDAVRLLLLDQRDNIAVAIADLHAGDVASLDRDEITLRNDVARGHKVALRRLAVGDDIIRYGEAVGAASAAIEVGEHVHVHNVLSKRLPGRS
ncbi:UxaA family hydrolase [Gordonia sp. CPCC 205515]|uniref:UxaA family hydrolase n=1 Tax=Gordonia sp. CPCC 205515 TaxID=3140791 RepID=UPI003AF3621F